MCVCVCLVDVSQIWLNEGKKWKQCHDKKIDQSIFAMLLWRYWWQKWYVHWDESCVKWKRRYHSETSLWLSFPFGFYSHHCELTTFHMCMNLLIVVHYRQTCVRLPPLGQNIAASLYMFNVHLVKMAKNDKRSFISKRLMNDKHVPIYKP